MDKYVQEIMLDIKEAFTTYLATNALSLNKGTYISLYELLKSYEYKSNNGKFYREFEIDHLTKVLGVNTKTYPKFYDLKRFFFEPAIKAINKCTDINISEIEYKKTGRNYTNVIFYCEQLDQTKVVIENKNILESKEIEQTKSLSSSIDKLVKVGVSENTARKWLDKFGENHINKNLAYSLAKQKEGKVKTSFTGYLAKSIEENWGDEFEKINKKSISSQRKAETEEKSIKPMKRANVNVKKEREFLLFLRLNQNLCRMLFLIW